MQLGAYYMTARDALAALIGAGIVCGVVVGWLGVKYAKEVK